MEEKDIPVICGFPQNEDELFFLFSKASYPLSPGQLREAIAQRSDPTVIEIDGKVVGFANFYRWEAGGRCSIGNVIVDPKARGRGIGRYLIEQMIGLAFSKHQAADVTVSCFNQDIVGLLFYSKLGFQPYAIEERQDKKGNRIALIHVRLPRNKEPLINSSFQPSDRSLPPTPIGGRRGAERAGIQDYEISMLLDSRMRGNDVIGINQSFPRVRAIMQHGDPDSSIRWRVAFCDAWFSTGSLKSEDRGTSSEEQTRNKIYSGT